MKHLTKLLALLVALCLLTVAAQGEGLTAADDLMAEPPVPEAGEAELWTGDMRDAGERAVQAVEGVAIDPAHFPDDVFRKKVKQLCDQDGDGTLSSGEIEGVTGLSLGGLGIADATGVECFWNLRTLDVSKNKLTGLDVTRNTKLEQLACGGNRLTSLDVSQCPLLLLSCEDNRLTYLDARRVSRMLNCANNQLTELLVSGGPQFDMLYCYGNRLKKLDLSGGFGALLVLYCQDNLLTDLDITGCVTLGCAFDPVYSYRQSLADDGKTAVFTDPVSYSGMRSSMGISVPNDVVKLDASVRVKENGKVVYDGTLAAKPTAGTGGTGAKKPLAIYLSRYGNALSNGAQTNVFFGYPAQLDVVMTPADAQTTLTWASENPGIATVKDGLVTAVSAGKTTVSVTTANGLRYAVLVYVPEADPQATPIPTPTPAPTKVPVNGKFKATSGTYKLVKGGTATFVKPVKSAKTVTIPATVKVNGKSVRVTAIAAKAFYKNKTLTAVTLGKYVKTIGKSAFYGCKKLKTVTIKTKKLTGKTVGANAFKGIYKKATFKCPKAKLKAYKALLKKKGAPAKAKYR